jgi:hypothetical protein
VLRNTRFVEAVAGGHKEPTHFRKATVRKPAAAKATLVRAPPFAGAHDARVACKGGGVTMRTYTVAILWRGDHQERRDATPYNNRYHHVFEQLISLGIDARPEVYSDDTAGEVREQLLRADGVLVWVDPIHQGLTRERLDAMLCDVAERGPWVSAHPDVILKMGVKEVLYRTKHLGWGTDTYLYRSIADFQATFPRRLRACGPLVIKQNRGNGGQGVWKVELTSGAATESRALILHAQRGSVPQELSLEDFMARCETYFASAGCVIDQPFQQRLPEGMIRCYMGVNKVVGFGHQLIKALIPPPPQGPDSPAAQPGPRIMHGANATPFQALRKKMEEQWTPQMTATLGIDATSLPIIWDADFLYGPRTASGEDSYVLCEINVSSVFRIPDQAPAAIAQLTLERLLASDADRTARRAGALN